MPSTPPPPDEPSTAKAAPDLETRASIAAVERDTGIPKDTLRVWERRYAFPLPARDAFGERCYPADQIDKLRLIKRLLDAGHRPGKLMGLDVETLGRMGEPRELRRRVSGRRAYSSEKRLSLKAYMSLVQGNHMDQLRRQLAQSQLQLGLARFVVDRVAPLAQMVDDAGLRGHLPTFAQRAFTETARRLLYSAVSGMPPPPPSAQPRVLLASFGLNHSGLGILMAEAMLALEGCPCLSLGVQTPVGDIAQGAIALQVQIVVLSFNESANPGELLGGLEQLRQALAAAVELWVCGPCAPLTRKPVPGVAMLPAFEGIADELERWRKANDA